MAQETIDGTNNEGDSNFRAKLNRMFTELYSAGGGGGAVSGTTGTFTGALAAASAALTGALTAATATLSGLFTTNSIKVDTGTKTATATAGAATLAKFAGVITSEALTTAAAAAYTLTITTTALGVAATDQAYASVANGTNTQGVPVVTRVTCGTNTVTVVITNLHASEALNGTLKVSYLVVKN